MIRTNRLSFVSTLRKHLRCLTSALPAHEREALSFLGIILIGGRIDEEQSQ